MDCITWEEWRQQSYELSSGRIEFPEDEDVMRRDYPITYYYFVHRVPPIDYLSNFFVYSDRGNKTGVFCDPDYSDMFDMFWGSE
ncbi:hypothetical protein NSTCB13_06348 [Nostoc sp. DSM 114160]|jgi:hypothetical protein